MKNGGPSLNIITPPNPHTEQKSAEINPKFQAHLNPDFNPLHARRSVSPMKIRNMPTPKNHTLNSMAMSADMGPISLVTGWKVKTQ